MAEEAGEGLFVFKKQTFVASVKVHGFQSAGATVSADCAHEAEGLGDAVDDAGIFGFDAFVFDVAESPVQG